MSVSPTSNAIPAQADDPADAPTQLSLWERVSFGAVRWSMAALVACLGLNLTYRLGRVFGTLEWLINFKRRRRFCARMVQFYPEGVSANRVRRSCREFFMHARCDRMFFLILDCLSRERAISLFSMDRRELLDEALADGSGVHIAMSHLGPHHVFSIMMCLLGYKMAGVRERRESGLRRYVQQRYCRRFPEYAGFRLFFSGTYPRDIYRALQEGYVLASAMDVARRHAPNQRMEAVTMFGKEHHFLSGPLRIATRSGATVFPGFILPEGGFRYRFVMDKAIFDPKKSTNNEETVRSAMSAYATSVEKAIRRYPAHITRI